MFKKILVFLIELLLSALLFSEGASIRLGVLKGISCAPCAYLIENKSKLSVQNIDFQLFESEQTELPKLLRGEIDAAFLTPTDAAKVFSKGNEPIIALGVVQNGNAYIITNDETYGALEDLKGKKVYCIETDSGDTGVFKNILSKKEIQTGEGEAAVNLDFSIPPANIANKIFLGEINYALLPEPLASIALQNLEDGRRAENLQKLYSSVEEGSTYPAMLLVARAEFAHKNRQLLKSFAEIYKNAVNWTHKNPSKASLLLKKHGLVNSQAAAIKALPNAALFWRDAATAKADLEKFYQITGTELPKEEFYRF